MGPVRDIPGTDWPRVYNRMLGTVPFATVSRFKIGLLAK